MPQGAKEIGIEKIRGGKSDYLAILQADEPLPNQYDTRVRVYAALHEIWPVYKRNWLILGKVV